MTILTLKKEKQHLVRVTAEDGREFLLDRTAVKDKGLYGGLTLSEEEFEELQEYSQYVRAKERALWYLDRRDHTEKGLRDKLRRAGFEENAILRVLDFLREYKMVDDERFARRFWEQCAARNVSRRATFAKLLEKGVPQEMIRTVLDEQPVDEEAQVRALLEKKYAKLLGEKESTQKVYAALMRKGFSYSAVRAVLKAYSEEFEFSEE